MTRRNIPSSMVPPEVEQACIELIDAAKAEGGTPLSEAEAAALDALPRVDVYASPDWAANSPWVIARNHVAVRKRYGHWLYSPAGSNEKSRRVPPYYWRLLEEQYRREVHANKDARKVRAEKLHQASSTARGRAKEAQAALILEIAKTITGSSFHKRISKDAGCSVATVKRALQKEKGSRAKGL